MLLYLLKTTFCLLLFLGFYHLVLEKEKMHRFNRFYLLGSILFAFLVPSFTIAVSPTEFTEPVVQEFQMIEQMQTTDIAFVEATEINYMSYVMGLYVLISGVLCFFFVKNLHKILSKTRKNEKVSYYNATVILLKENILPHTFLKYIFINKKEYTNDQQEQLILTHELAHVKQKHSFDVLFIELLQIVFWFIPIFKLYKKAIQLNHEFLADDAVIKSHKNITEYQHLLLNTTAQNNNIYLASNLNYSLTKKRLLMMTTPSCKTKILLKKIAIVPLLTGFIFAFSHKVEAQQTKQKPQVIEVNKQEKSLSRKGMKEYSTLFNKGKKTNIYKEKDVQKMISLYEKMSRKQQNSITDIRKVIPPPPPKMDIVYTYNRLAKRVKSISKNRKANVIYLKELYSKMNATQKNQVVKPSNIPVRIQVIEKKKNEKTPKPQIREIKPVKIEVIKNEKRPKVIEIIETPIKEIEEVVEVRELIEVKENLEEKEVEEVIEVRELIEVKEEIEEKEVVEVREVVVQELKEFKKKQGIKKIPPPPTPLKKNATKKEIKHYNKAYKLWKKKIKNIPPPQKKQ